MNEKDFNTISNGFTDILNIISVVCDAYTRYNEINRRSLVRPVNLLRNEEFFRTCSEQLIDLNEEDFWLATKISADNFDVLLRLLEKKLVRYSIREPIRPRKRLSLTLFYLAQGCTIKVLALNQKLGVSTVRKIIYETCEAIWEELSCIYISPPNEEEWKRVASDFYITTGMPNCIGAIDGKQVKIICPNRSSSLSYKYKSKFSIVLFAACNSKNIFTFVDVGAYENQSDGEIFANSILGQKLLNNNLDVPSDSYLPNSSVEFPYYFVADNAFPLKKNIMRPYPGRNLSCDKKHYNETISKARECIEHSFGILTSRWRILNNTIYAAPKNVEKMILATTVLHNFLILNKDSVYTMDTDDVFENKSKENTYGGNRSSSETFELRNILKDYLNS